MYKIKLYTQNGNFMNEWKCSFFEPSWDYKAVRLYMIEGEEEKEVIISGGIIIVEEIPGEKQVKKSA